LVRNVQRASDDGDLLTGVRPGGAVSLEGLLLTRFFIVFSPRESAEPTAGTRS
jgi:hypothetical protein